MPPSHYYKRDRDDKINSINRCFTDADQGRIELALVRIGDLLEEFHDDASVIYARGLLMRDFLGCGLSARDDFEKAYHAAPNGDEVRGLAACNAALLARGYEEFEKWSAIALTILPKDEGMNSMRSALAEAKDEEADFHATLVNFVVATPPEELADHPGSAASALEVALTGRAVFRVDEEVDVRKHRAHYLRELDKRAAQTREMLCEHFPPKDRLALQHALEEIERTIALEDSDAELWNFRGAWCFLLRRAEDAIASAEKAIALRPNGYAKPWINKANILFYMKRFDDARQCAQEAVRQAKSAGLSADLQQAQELTIIRTAGNEDPDEGKCAKWIEDFLKAAALTSRKEVSQKGWSGKHEELANGFLKRTRLFGADWHPAYLRMIAEMLIYFGPETCRITLVEARGQNEAGYENALNALLYLIAHSSGALQRDATRLLCLMFLGTGTVNGAIKMYRQAVMETAAASSEFQGLPAIVREELGRINLWLPKLIADQEPVDEAGVGHARRTVLWRFDPAHMTDRAIPHQAPGGCATIIVMALVVTIGWILCKIL